MVSQNVTRLVLTPVVACAARCRRVLDALARAGRARLGALAPAGADVMRSASTFSRVARALRLIALLELRLRAMVEAGPSASAANSNASPDVATATPGASSPERGERLEEDEDLEEIEDLEEDEDLDAELDREERADRLEFERFGFDRTRGALGADRRSLTEIVAAICRDLDFSPEATLQAQAPFAELEALLAGTPPPDSAPLPMDREPPGSPLLTPDPGVSVAGSARVDARGPKRPP